MTRDSFHWFGLRVSYFRFWDYARVAPQSLDLRFGSQSGASRSTTKRQRGLVLDPAIVTTFAWAELGHPDAENSNEGGRELSLSLGSRPWLQLSTSSLDIIANQKDGSGRAPISGRTESFGSKEEL